MKIELNWNSHDIDELNQLKTNFNEFREIFQRVGTGKINLANDEPLFIESLRTLIDCTDLIDELIEMAEKQQLDEITAAKQPTSINTPEVEDRKPYTMKAKNNQHQ